MKIRELLSEESIELQGAAAGKKEALDQMVDLMAKSGKINDVETYRKGVYAREEESTTGIGEGIAGTCGDGDTGRSGFRCAGWRKGKPDFSDCSAKYRRQCTFGCIE